MKQVVVDIAYICDGKACEICNKEDCRHTFDIEHALHKDSLDRRLFAYHTYDDTIYFWEEDQHANLNSV